MQLERNRMSEFVSEQRKDGRRHNTALAYDPRVLEFKQFCEHQYSNDEYKYTIDAEKVYRFMFYTAFREKKAPGAAEAPDKENQGRDDRKKKQRKRKQSGGEPTKKKDPNQKFDTEEYEKISGAFGKGGSVFDFPVAKNPIGPTSFNTYKSVLKLMHLEQQRNGANNLPWEFVWDLNCSELQKHVKEREPAKKKATFQEKHGEFAPYIIVE